MGIRISTKEKLDTNAYASMIIREVDGSFFVKINGGKSDTQSLMVSYRLSDMIKGLSDFHKIVEIVDSFLENASISSIETDEFHVGYGGNFIKVNGSRTLYLQIDNHELLRYLVRMIKSKYDRDRYKYVASVSCNEYDINLSDKKSTYGMEFISCENCELNCDLGYCPKSLTFNLMYLKGKILGFDRAFIERFINDKLWECGEVATICEKRKEVKLIDGRTVVGAYTDAYCIMCGNLEIRFKCSAFSRKYIEQFCNDIVNKYNGELEKLNSCKKRQLKMEGFR